MSEKMIFLEKGKNQFPLPDESIPKVRQLEDLLNWAKKRVPYFEALPEYDVETQYGRIRAGFLHTFGTGLSEEPQKLFCYLGIPKEADRGKKVPGMLLIHGGGGHAFTIWMEEWMKRGYAAVQIDCYGHMPLEDGRYCHNAHEPEKEQTYRSTPTGIIHGGFDLNHPRDRITDQGMFHVTAANILAGNLLRAQECVDAAKIGITGISWGGFTTCIVISYDQRFAFAAPVYGTAYLDHGPSYFHGQMKDRDCAKLWEVKNRLPHFKRPILWVNDSQDDAFPPNCSTLCFLHSADGTMCLKYDLPHYHKFDIEEVYAFADHVIFGDKPLPHFTEIADWTKGRDYVLEASLWGTSQAWAELYYLTEPMTYHDEGGCMKMDQAYHHLSLGKVEDSRVHIRVPEEAAAYFVELWQGGLMTSTPFVEFYKQG